MKSKIFAAVCSCFLAACASPQGTTEHPERLNTAIAVAQRTEQFSFELARLEREQTDLQQRRSMRKLRSLWSDYVRARRNEAALFATQGIAFDRNYYRLHHRLLDAQFAAIRRLSSL